MAKILKIYLRKILMKITKQTIRNFFLAIIGIMLLVYIYIFMKFKPPNMKFRSPGDGYSIKTIGCSIPSLHPYDPSVIPFIFKDPPIKCGTVLPSLVYSDLDTLYVNTTVLPKYNVTNLNNFHCCYQEILKKQLPGVQRELSNDTYTYFPRCTPFKTMAKLDNEFVRVICKNNGKEIYRDFHSFVPFRKSITKRPSVLVMGVDSTSRVNLHRQMPKTVAYLQKLHAIEFFGYNRIADNTHPNLIPALTGKFRSELYEECIPSQWFKTARKYDACNIIWKDYKKAGFLTALAEDAAWVGVFNHGYNYGFDKQPTDYYWNLFNFAMETELGIPINNKTETYLCAGTKYIYHTLLDYMMKFLRILKHESFFGWFWQCTLTHSGFNFASLGDKDYERIFKELNETDVLNNTIIIFMSDHGERSSRVLLTHQGYLEGRLPFLYVLVPPWFERLYPTAVQNLRTNAKRLVTTFDIHETLKDLIKVEDLTTDILQKRTEKLEDVRGVSLFLPISERRTCKSAEISIHWCSCFKSIPVEITDPVVESIAFYLISYINLKLQDEESCSPLELSSILKARLLVSEEFRDSALILKSKLRIYNYIVTIKTIPGGGIFESTVRCYNCVDKTDFETQGEISRLNKYGKEGKCITDAQLRVFCYCKRE